jgi:GT2 family glycosyltransferase
MSSTIVIPNWNGRRFLGRCFSALRAQTASDFRIVLVDNGSSDDSVAFTRKRFPEVDVVEVGENRGFAAAVNVGVLAAKTPYVALLNNDTEAGPRWLEELELALVRHPRAAAVTSKMLLLDRPDTVDDAGDMLTYTFLPYPRGHGQTDEGQYEEETEVFSACGGACLWRRDVLDELGLFDEAFFAYYEDVDIGFRARLAGYECWYAPRSIVLHARGGSAEAETDFTYFQHLKNRWFLISKNAPGWLIRRRFAWILFGELVWWRRAIAARKVGPVVRAYGAALAERKSVGERRREVRALTRISRAELERLLETR